MWVKLSSELYAQDLMELQRRGFVRGKYYKVVDRCNYDGYATYTVIDLINRDRIFAPIGVDFFEKPVAHVECIDNEGKEDRLTLLKTYEILDMGYTFGELWIRIKQDNDEMGKYPLKRFVLVASNVIPIGEIAEPLEPCEEEDNEGNDDMEEQKPMPMKGLEVMCINNTYYEEEFTIGKKYFVLGDGVLGDSVYVESNTSRIFEMRRDRFVYVDHEDNVILR